MIERRVWVWQENCKSQNNIPSCVLLHDSSLCVEEVKRMNDAVCDIQIVASFMSTNYKDPMRVQAKT